MTATATKFKSTPDTLNPKRPEPGIYYGVSDTDYFATRALSNTELRRWAYGGDGPQRTVAAIGSAFDVIVTQPQLKDRVVKIPDLDLRTTEGKDKYAQLAEENEGKVILRPDEYAKVANMIERVQSDNDLSKLYAKCGENTTQAVAVWRDVDTGVLCKARIDQVTDKALIDWKTTSCSGPEEFADAIWRFGYNQQAAMYLDGFAALDQERGAWAWAVVSKRPDLGYPCWLMLAKPMHVDTGREQWRGLLARWNEAHKDHEYQLPF